MINTIAKFGALALALAVAPGAFASGMGMGGMGMGGMGMMGMGSMSSGFSMVGVPAGTGIVFSNDDRRLVGSGSAISSNDTVSAAVMPYLVDERGEVVFDSGAETGTAVTSRSFDSSDVRRTGAINARVFRRFDRF